VPQYPARQPKSANGSPASRMFEGRPDHAATAATRGMPIVCSFTSLMTLMIYSCLNIGRWPDTSSWEKG
jgi:hypothetical protein